jgi:hypothetical protein
VKRIVVLVISLLIGAPAETDASSNQDVTAGIRMYAEMSFNKVEGEYYGVQVVIVPYYQGLKVLWRTASGRVNAPLLLDAVRENSIIKITVPESSDDFGEWKLSVEGNVLRAQGPRDLHFELREVELK